jgi:dihydrofolate reductase
VSATVLYMSTSLDGFIAGPNETPDNGLGDGGLRLHDWLMTGGDLDLDAIRRAGGVNSRIVDEFIATGAVVAGTGTFEPADGWEGDHHDEVPIVILRRHESAADFAQLPLVTYLDDVTTAMSRAEEAAGDSNVLVHGAGTAQLALAGGILDELELHVVPVLLRPGTSSVRGPRAGADRARADADPRGRGRRHAHALPRPALRPVTRPPSPGQGR